MTPYLNLSGSSGVVAYEIGIDYIRVQFRGADIYIYNHSRPGRIHVENMKQLAMSGRGLGTYINQHVRTLYAHKL